MEQYISKAALVAEIEKRIKEHHSGYLVCLKDMLFFINTLEVKEVKEPADSFIEKAEKYLKNQFIKDVSILAGGVVNVDFSIAIKNFVNYMKGE